MREQECKNIGTAHARCDDTQAMENTEEDLIPRPYQSLVLDLALNQNTIVFLPTGSGKTFIAVMLLKRLSASVQEKFTDGGKRTFFLVNTVALAEQQKNYIQRHTCLAVGHFTGDMNVDYWNEEKWREELNKYQVLVMTAQILLDILNHKYLQLGDINLLVFDECHHAVNQHCMSKIMRLFEYCPREEQPRVLGLTATLINSSVKFQKVPVLVSDLEETFRSKIATLENVDEVESFSTCPNEKHHQFDALPKNEIMTEINCHLLKLSEFVMNYVFQENRSSAPEIEGAHLLKSKSLGKKLSNKLTDVWKHVETLGLYGGSLSALKLIILIERLRARAEMPDTTMIYGVMITTLTMIRKLLEDEMKNYDASTKLLKFSSPQVISLLEVLKEYHPGDGRGIVFVERRLTAKVLFHILRAASENIQGLEFVRPDFVVGFQSNPLKYTRECQLEKKWNRQAIEKFQKGETNILVASDVLEEGIDIPQCKLVVKFDAPKSYRSYIQSKGRARHKDSNFVVLIPKDYKQKLMIELREYQNIENILRKVLCGNQISSSVEMDVPNCKDIDAIIYFAKDGARVSYNSAIPLVNRYCSMLPQDLFTKLVPYWFLKEDTKPPFYQCLLHLPINSPLKEGFLGKLMLNKKLAKQSAAYAACVALHEAGELNDHLLPVGHHPEAFIDEEGIFAIYHKASEKDDMEQPGTKKCRRIYEKQVPKALSGYAPSEGITLYLHILSISPSYEAPPEDNTRKYTFYQLLQSENNYAILNTERLPKLCDFPLFLNVGKIIVSVAVNYSTLQLSKEQILKIQKFNSMLFFDLLKLHKSYIVSDKKNGGNNYLVVPVKKQEKDHYGIDWKVIENNCQLPAFKQPTEAERLGNEGCDWSKFQHSLVVPWYRGLPPDQIYVVTQVCGDLSPLSSFPTHAFSTFEEYFYKKYNLVINNSSQPLFEVKAITNRLNYLKPRTGHVSGRNKRQELNDDFEEHLVPELCIHIDFPSTLWVKAVCLPSCLHRISHLLLAEELRREIADNLNLLPLEEENWETLSIDPVCISDDDGSKRSASHSNIKGNVSTIMNTKNSAWGGEGEPVDIDRERVDDVTLMDILYYDEFINKSAVTCDNSFSTMEDEFVNSSIMTPEDVPAPKIAIFEKCGGVQLSKILQALTCACSNDAMNLERLETLGDSFLKFATSLFLFLQYPKLDEGKLTQVKGKIVGNRNLFYCGRNRNIIGKMKVHEFNPKSDWIPPTYCIPKELLQSLLDNKLCPSILFEVTFPREEQESGVLSFSSHNLWQETVKTSDRHYTPSPTESLMGVQSVPDKMVADSVEALIGTYLQAYGIEGAFKIVGWLGILPSRLADVSYFLRSPECSPFVCDENDREAKLNHLLNEFEGLHQLENRIQYVFNNKGYLLQALSHASYSQNRLTDCYQRLEFLGDAILDFLVTCHIYEHCEGLSPGDLTDLRSALVNNITFGSLAVRYGFHHFCRYDSPKLFEKIDAFVNFQEKQGHKINEDVLLLLDEKDAIGESVDVPKVLGDLFESLAGAIYLDSGKNLQTVWRVYYTLMKNEIELFSQDIPKQPVRMLYEQCNPPPAFSATQSIEDQKKVVVELEVLIRGERKLYYGVGQNKAEAKRTAAKLALRDMRMKWK